MRTIRIGILGCGVVGSGTIRVLQDNADEIAQRVGARLVVERVAVKDAGKLRPVSLPDGVLTDDPNAVLDDPEIDIVAELIGGVSPAGDYIRRAIENGKNVVTANKELMAKQGHELMVGAREKKLDFFLEGSVAGGIPILAAMKESLAGNKISEIMGIVNGTTNYILSRMTDEGAELATTLKAAQELGYAEADPTSDVDGFDAQYKLAILSSMAFNTTLGADDIAAQGIRQIAARDIAVARDLGYRIKLLAVARAVGEHSIQAHVHPALLPAKHPLASVSDVFNAVLVRGDAVGEVMFYGRGAGSLPTGSAVVGDLIASARNILRGSTGRVGCTCYASRTVVPISDVESKFYIRLHALDKPKVLASIANVFGDFDVSIESVVQRALQGEEAEIVWVTHRAREANIRGALDVISRLSVVAGVHNWIRVEE